LDEALLDEAEGLVVPPRNCDGFIEEARCEDDGEMGAAMEAHRDFVLGNGDIGRHVDEIAEDLAGLGIVIAAHAARHAAIEP
jgi:hypothetical protein